MHKSGTEFNCVHFTMKEKLILNPLLHRGVKWWIEATELFKNIGSNQLPLEKKQEI